MQALYLQESTSLPWLHLCQATYKIQYPESRAEETEVELKLAEVTKDDLSELSDTNLWLNELSNTEDGAGLAAGRNKPFPAHEEIITNSLWACFMPNSTSPLISPFQALSHQEISKDSQQEVLVVSCQEPFKVLLNSGKKSNLHS